MPQTPEEAFRYGYERGREGKEDAENVLGGILDGLGSSFPEPFGPSEAEYRAAEAARLRGWEAGRIEYERAKARSEGAPPTGDDGDRIAWPSQYSASQGTGAVMMFAILGVAVVAVIIAAVIHYVVYGRATAEGIVDAYRQRDSASAVRASELDSARAADAANEEWAARDRSLYGVGMSIRAAILSGDSSFILGHLADSVRVAGGPVPRAVCQQQYTRCVDTAFAALVRDDSVPVENRGHFWHVGPVDYSLGRDTWAIDGFDADQARFAIALRAAAAAIRQQVLAGDSASLLVHMADTVELWGGEPTERVPRAVCEANYSRCMPPQVIDQIRYSDPSQNRDGLFVGPIAFAIEGQEWKITRIRTAP